MQATLHMLCGKIASGKSTLAAELAQAPATILLSEDHFLARLYPGEITTLEHYARSAARLREAIGPHVVELLRSGLSVVLDFPANTPATRGWMRELVERTGSAHQLHYLEASDEACKRRLRGRNAAGNHEYQASDAEFDLFTAYFVAPAADEGFHVVTHRS